MESEEVLLSVRCREEVYCDIGGFFGMWIKETDYDCHKCDGKMKHTDLEVYKCNKCGYAKSIEYLDFSYGSYFDYN